MKQPWKFAALATPSGSLLTDCLSANKRLQARVDAVLRRLRVKEPPWLMPDFKPLGEGVGEVRVDYQKVEYRFYGYFGSEPRQFTVILIGDDKKRQERHIQAAKELKRHIDLLPTFPRVENYDV